MNKKWFIVVGMVVLLGIVGIVGCAPGATGTLELKGNLNNQQEGIWVNGEGKVTVVPDVAMIYFGVESQQATVEAARDEAAAAMESVLQALKDAGVSEEDIQTQYFNISRVTRWDVDKQEETVIGYRVSNTVTAKIRNVDDTGSVIDAVAGAGGDLTRINGISFTLDDPSDYQEQARKLAVEDAVAKAGVLAEAANVSLGSLTYISENSYLPGPVYRNAVDTAEGVPAPSVETPISPGEMEITVTVQMIYEISG